MKVTTRDFQILKGENTFEFPEGITIIQGRNASGKSTLFYAILYALTNPQGKAGIINWDAKQASVTIENNGAKVTWIKTPKSSEYIDELTGRHDVKCSKLDSRDFGDLGFYFDEKDNVINIHDEWAKIFPFGYADTEMFKQFEAIFNISCTYQILDDLKSDEANTKSQITNITSKMDEITQRKNTIQDILQKLNVSDVEALIYSLKEKQDKLYVLEQDINILRNNSVYLNQTIPNEFNCTYLDNVSQKVNVLYRDLNILKNNLAISNLKIPQEQTFNLKENTITQDVTNFTNLIKNIQQYEETIQQLDIQYKDVLDKVKQIKVCPTCGHKLEEQDYAKL